MKKVLFSLLVASVGATVLTMGDPDRRPCAGTVRAQSHCASSCNTSEADRDQQIAESENSVRTQRRFSQFSPSAAAINSSVSDDRTSPDDGNSDHASNKGSIDDGSNALE